MHGNVGELHGLEADEEEHGDEEGESGEEVGEQNADEDEGGEHAEVEEEELVGEVVEDEVDGGHVLREAVEDAPDRVEVEERNAGSEKCREHGGVEAIALHQSQREDHEAPQKRGQHEQSCKEEEHRRIVHLKLLGGRFLQPAADPLRDPETQKRLEEHHQHDQGKGEPSA